MEQWYQIGHEQLQQHAGGGLLCSFNGSVLQMLQSLRPEFPWIPWNFVQVPKGFWDSLSNRRLALDFLSKGLQIQHYADWYHIKLPQIRAKEGCGGALLSLYAGSTPQMLQDLCPEFRWVPWHFSNLPHGFWDDPKNQKQALEWLQKELGVRKWSDWYRVTIDQIQAHGCSGLARRFDNCLSQLLLTVFPNAPLHVWKFRPEDQIPGFWLDANNLRQYFDWLVRRFRLSSPLSLAFQPRQFFTKNKAPLKTKKGIKRALKRVYTGVKKRAS
jgi:hypothetical protein